jgi:hypothetical protein
MESLRDVLLAVGTIAALLLLGCGILWGYRRLRRTAESAQERTFDGLEVYSEPMPGHVSVVFHTYYGFIAFVSQTEHRFWASPEDARMALWRLHRFNLVWGWFAYGALIIPLLSYGNYLAQQRSIRKQAMRLPD